MWKALKINVRENGVKKYDFDEKYKYIGGRSLVTQFLMDEVDPTCDPLGAENKLIICNGVFSGTNLTTAHRMSIGGKSPLTGGIKESNVGGTAANYLAGHGIRMIVLEDIPTDSEWKIVHIGKTGTIQLRSASDLVGLNSYDVSSKVAEMYGKDTSFIAIGQSGEMGYKNAGITVSEFRSGHPCRLAARGGMGSVMGSKKIKAIIIEKPAKRYQPEITEGFKKVVLTINKKIVELAKTNVISQVGTAAIVAATGPTGILPVRNFSGEIFKEYEKLGPEVFMKNLAERGGSNKVPCQPGCIIACSNHYNDKDGNHLTSGFEYETIGLCGSNLDISDLDVVAKIDRFCDDFGVDTIETGATLGVCMEMGKIPWGDADAVFKLLDEMKRGTEFGKIMGQGTYETGKHLGCKRIPTVKKQALAAYEPRNLQATGITYATSAQGADHTAGPSLGATPEFIDDTSKFFQPVVSRTLQLIVMFVDSSVCEFALGILGENNLGLLYDAYAELYNMKFGEEEATEMSKKYLLMEREFNKIAGFTVEDDRLPEFFYKEPSKATGSTFDFTDVELQSVCNYG